MDGFFSYSLYFRGCNVDGAALATGHIMEPGRLTAVLPRASICTTKLTTVTINQIWYLFYKTIIDECLDATARGLLDAPGPMDSTIIGTATLPYRG
jgi:hypothetical protein